MGLYNTTPQLVPYSIFAMQSVKYKNAKNLQFIHTLTQWRKAQTPLLRFVADLLNNRSATSFCAFSRTTTCDQHNKRGDTSDRRVATLVVLITSPTTCQDVVDLLLQLRLLWISPQQIEIMDIALSKGFWRPQTEAT